MASRVVFVPGFMQRANAWAALAALVERYPSECLEHASFTGEGRMREIAAALSSSDVLVGYSLGGRLALHAVIRGLRPSALVLVGCSAGIEDPAARARRRRSDDALADWMEHETIQRIVSCWERQPIFSTQQPDLLARQRAGRLSHRPRDLATLLRSAGQAALPPVWAELTKLELPVLTLAGALDNAYADAARRMAELLPRGRVELIAGAGHAPQLERPRETAASILAFIDQLG